MNRPLRIGTRGSPLALAQAHMVAAALRAAHNWPAERIEIVPITTTGDVIQDRSLAEVGGKGLWTKELDRCLIDGRTDLSVHSMKDVETIRPPELLIAAMLPRAGVCDRLIGAPAITALPRGARVGTSSPRRRAQLLRRRPDLEIVLIRGNVQTRLAKLAGGEADATLLAAAGLERLGLESIGSTVDDMIPAPAQGAVGVEINAGAGHIGDLIRAIDHAPTHICVNAERRLLAGLGGNCRSPVAALARLDENKVTLRAEILSEDGSDIVERTATFDAGDGEAPLALARDLLRDAPPSIRTLFDGDA